MPSDCERFWERDTYAIVGHQGPRPFPKITYKELKKAGKTVYPIDPSGTEVDGDTTYADFAALPATPQAAILEVPKEETAAWVRKAADAGVTSLWIHQMTDTPEALAEARERGLDVITGHCAVMYTKPGFSMHSFHRWIMKATGKF